MQIVTGIEVNSEAYFPKLREYCPSAEGMRAIFIYSIKCYLAIKRANELFLKLAIHLIYTNHLTF